MYVLLDIEWLTNQQNHFCPTQIAALRVSDDWQDHELFFSRIRPRDPSFYVWNHVSFTGGNSVDFLEAKGLYRVMSDLMKWLRSDDIICLWHEESMNIFKSAVSLALKQKVPHNMVVLSDYMPKYLQQKGNVRNAPHKIAGACGMRIAYPSHRSDCDVMNMRSALQGLGFCADDLKRPPEKLDSPTPVVLSPYFLDERINVVHLEGCQCMPKEAKRVENPGKKFLFKDGLYFCSCMSKELKRARRERNKDIISRTEYNFVYSKKSDVFHRRDCGLILNTIGDIKGSVYYNGCEASGRRPCKVCNPVAGKWVKNKKKKGFPDENGVCKRALTDAEKRGLIRYIQAKNERFSKNRDDFSSSIEKNDFYTLTQPRFGFFASTGYSTFHLRNCQKLKGRSHVKGFATYKDAIRSGYQPCKYCKPSNKNDITCSVPITSRYRTGESTANLESLCAQFGYDFSCENSVFCLNTPAGKWKVDTSISPYVIQHINLAMTPDETEYHRQPRLFLSLSDVFWYIHRHDAKLMPESNVAV